MCPSFWYQDHRTNVYVAAPEMHVYPCCYYYLYYFWSRECICRTFCSFILYVSHTYVSVPNAPSDIHPSTSNSTSIEITWTQRGSADDCTVAVADTSATVVADCESGRATISNLPVAGKEYAITVTSKSGTENAATVIKARTSKYHIENT